MGGLKSLLEEAPMNNKRRNEEPIHDKKHLQMEREEPI